MIVRLEGLLALFLLDLRGYVFRGHFGGLQSGLDDLGNHFFIVDVPDHVTGHVDIVEVHRLHVLVDLDPPALPDDVALFFLEITAGHTVNTFNRRGFRFGTPCTLTLGQFDLGRELRTVNTRSPDESVRLDRFLVGDNEAPLFGLGDRRIEHDFGALLPQI